MTTRERPGTGWLPRVGRFTWILAACQALYFGGVSVDLTLTAVVGLSLAPSPLLAALPLAVISTSGTVCSVLAGLLTARLGHRNVLMIGAGFGIAGGLLSAVGVAAGSFAVLCAGTALVGAYRATGGYIRYMAADLAPEGQRDQALSFVLYGGLVAAFAGPFAATAAAGMFGREYVGSYVLVAVLAAANIAMQLLIPSRVAAQPAPDGTPAEKPVPVPVREAAARPDFGIGLLALAASGAIMTMVMAMGPLASYEAGHTSADGALMIQWHLVGMFAPSIVSGAVLARLGPHWTGLAGATLFAAGAVAGLSGGSVTTMVVALALNGVGWNFLYLAGSSLVVRSYPPGRGGRIQAVAEGTNAVTGVAASFTSSAVLIAAGWSGANWPVLGVSVAVGIALVLGAARARRAALAATPAPA